MYRAGILILLLSLSIKAQSLSPVRIHYDGGGDWYGNKTPWQNILEQINFDMGLEVLKQEVSSKITDRDFNHYPIAYIAGHGNISFSDDEIAALRSYLINGGFLIADDDFDTQVEGEDAERLIPVLDMLNHNSEPSVTYKTNEEGTVEVKARRVIKAGEEIYNRYREEEEMNMPYHRFFSRFGFVPGITEPIKNLLLDKSSVFFAKRKEI